MLNSPVPVLKALSDPQAMTLGPDRWFLIDALTPLLNALNTRPISPFRAQIVHACQCPALK